MRRVSVQSGSEPEYVIQDIMDDTLGRALSKDMDGLDYPSVRTSSFNRSGEHGIFISNMFYGERRISIPGDIYGYEDDVSYEAQRRALTKAFSIRKDSGGFLIPLTLRFTTNDGNDYQVTGQAVKLPAPRRAFFLTEYLVDFLSDSVYIYGQELVSYDIHPYVGGGFVIPFVLPVIFGAGSGGEVVVQNAGDAPALPVITLTGPLTFPRLLNATTGFSMALNVNLGAGDEIVIDMSNRTIVQGGTTNRISTKTTDSNFWWLDSGDNRIILTTGSGSDAGKANVSFRNGYYGV